MEIDASTGSLAREAIDTGAFDLGLLTSACPKIQ
jgi:hypothetical protein